MKTANVELMLSLPAKRLSLLLLLFSLASPGAVRQQNTNRSSATTSIARESSTQVRRKTFEVVWRTVKERYFDQTFNGLDWQKVRERYAPQVAAVKSDEELYKLLNRMLGELHVSHLGIVPPEAIASTSQPPGEVGLDFRILDGLPVITRVMPGSPAARAGLRPGFIIKKIDDADVEKEELSDALDSLKGAPQTKVSLTYLDAEERQHEVALERQTLYTDADHLGEIGLYAEFESKRIDDGTGYIRFSQFIPSLKKKLRAAIRSLSDARGLIIDLRGNGGGDDEVALRMANLLFAERVVLILSKTRKGDDRSYQAKPEKHPYLGAVVILQDELSGSASEQFAAGMQAAGRAAIIGLKSAGDDMDADLKKLPTGAYLIYPYGQPRTPKGAIIEGRGVVPDLEVKLSRAALLRGVDSQLDAALKYIRQKSLEQKSAGRNDQP